MLCNYSTTFIQIVLSFSRTALKVIMKTLVSCCTEAETEPLVPNKDDPATMTLGPVSSGKQEEQNNCQLDKQTQPPRYEPGIYINTGVTMTDNV